MMKKVKIPEKVSERNISVTDFRELADVLFNAEAAKNALKSGYGIENVKYFLPLGVTPVSGCVYNGALILCGSDFKIYESGEDGYVTVEDTAYSEKTLFAQTLYNGENCLLVTDGTTTALYAPDYSSNAAVMPSADKLCVHNETVLCGKEHSVSFSERGNPFDWEYSSDGGAYLVLEEIYGDITGIESYAGSVFVFCENAVIRLTDVNDLKNLKVTEFFRSPSPIVDGSVKLCGNDVVFATENELYRLDKSGAERVLGDVYGYAPDFSNCSAGYKNGRYFITFRSAEMCGEKLILCFSPSQKTYSVLRAGNVSILFDNYCVSGGLLGKACLTDRLFSGKKVCYTRSRFLYFDTPEIKRLAHLSLYTASPVTLKICTDGGSRAYNLNSGINAIKPCLQSSFFTVEIFGKDVYKITDLKFTINTFGGK